MTATRATLGFHAIKGWFNEIDLRCFTALLESQRDTPPGDLVELGAFRPGGVVSFDDYRNHGSPGVAAAVWESVCTDGLIPIATTRKKMSACYDNPSAPGDAAGDDRRGPAVFDVDEIDIRGRTMIRMSLNQKRSRPGEDKDD